MSHGGTGPAIGTLRHGELMMTKRSGKKQAVFSRYSTKREKKAWNHPWGSLSALPGWVAGPVSSSQSKWDNASSFERATGPGSLARSTDAIKHRRSISTVSNIAGVLHQNNCAGRKDDQKGGIRAALEQKDVGAAVDYYDQNRFFRWVQEGSLQKETAPVSMQRQTIPKAHGSVIGPHITVTQRSEPENCSTDLHDAYSTNFTKNRPKALRRERPPNNSDLQKIRQKNLNQFSSVQRAETRTEAEVFNVSQSVMLDFKQLYKPRERTLKVSPANARGLLDHPQEESGENPEGAMSDQLDKLQPATELPYRIQYSLIQKPRPGEAESSTWEATKASKMTHQVNLVQTDYFESLLGSDGLEEGEKARSFLCSQAVRRDIQRQLKKPLAGEKDARRSSLTCGDGPRHQQLKVSKLAQTSPLKRAPVKKAVVERANETGNQLSRRIAMAASSFSAAKAFHSSNQKPHQSHLSSKFGKLLKFEGTSSAQHAQSDTINQDPRSPDPKSLRSMDAKDKALSPLLSVKGALNAQIIEEKPQKEEDPLGQNSPQFGQLDDGSTSKVREKSTKNILSGREQLDELCKTLDKKIEQRPLRQRAEVIAQAVLVDKVDIDEALRAHDAYLVRKLEHKARGKEQDVAEEERHQAETLQPQGHQGLARSSTQVSAKASLRPSKANTHSQSPQADVFDGALRRGTTMGSRVLGGSQDLGPSLKLRRRGTTSHGRRGSGPRPEQPLSPEESELLETQAAGTRIKPIAISNTILEVRQSAHDTSREEYKKKLAALFEQEKLSKEYLRIIGFASQLKRAGSSKPTQAEAVRSLLEGQERQREQRERELEQLGESQSQSPCRVPTQAGRAWQVLGKALAQLEPATVADLHDGTGTASSKPSLQLNLSQLPLKGKEKPPDLTYEQAVNPLNVIFRREVKQALRPPEDPTPIITSIEKTTSFLPAGEYASELIDEMANMSFDHKKQLKLQKIRIEQDRKMADRRQALAKMKLRQFQANASRVAGRPASSQPSVQDSDCEEKAEPQKFVKRDPDHPTENLADRQATAHQQEVHGADSHHEKEASQQESAEGEQPASEPVSLPPEQPAAQVQESNRRLGEPKMQLEEKYESVFSFGPSTVALKVPKGPRQRQSRLPGQAAPTAAIGAGARNEASSAGSSARRKAEKHAHHCRARPSALSALKGTIAGHDARGGDSPGGSGSETPTSSRESQSGSGEDGSGGEAALGRAKGGGVVADSLASFFKRTHTLKQRGAKEKAVQYANGYLRKELQRIYNQSYQAVGKIQSAREKRILGEVEPAKNEAVSNARRSEEYGDRIEMYEELEVEKHVYGVVKNGENRILEDDEGLTLFDQEIIEYSKNCSKARAVTMTSIFTKIKNNCLALSNYYLQNHGHAIQCTLASSKNPRNLIKRLSVNNCGLRDEGLSAILQGILSQDFIECISLSNEEIGPKTIEQLNILSQLELDQKLTKPISELYFQGLKMPRGCTAPFLGVLIRFTNLRKVKISGINLSEPSAFSQLLHIVMACEHLGQMQSVDISHTSLRSRQILQISEALALNQNLSNVNLSNNTLDDKIRMEVRDTVEASKGRPSQTETVQVCDEQKFCENIAIFIEKNSNLMHINLGGMNLTRDGLLKIRNEGISRSESLLGIHIGNNQTNWNPIAEPSLQFMDDPRAELMNSLQSLEEPTKNQYAASAKHNHIPFIGVLKQNHTDRAMFILESTQAESLQGALSPEEGSQEQKNKEFLANQYLISQNQRGIQANKQTTLDEAGGMRSLERSEQVWTRKVGYAELLWNKAYGQKQREFLETDAEDWGGQEAGNSAFSADAAANWIAEPKDDDCYICNRSNLVHVFFCRKHVLKDFQVVSNLETKKKLIQFYGLDAPDQQCEEGRAPLICGSLTKWRLWKMVPPLYFGLVRLAHQVEEQPHRFAAGKHKETVRDIMATSSTAPVDARKLKQAQATVDNARALLIDNLNYPYPSDRHHLADSILSFNLPGWGCYLYDQLDQVIKSDEAQIFNLTQHHGLHTYANQGDRDQASEEVNTALMNYIQRKALAKRCHEHSSSSDDEQAPIDESKAHDRDQPLFNPRRFEKTELSDAFVFSDFVSPGLHSVLVYDPMDGEFYYQQILVRVRKQDHAPAKRRRARRAAPPRPGAPGGGQDHPETVVDGAGKEARKAN